MAGVIDTAIFITLMSASAIPSDGLDGAIHGVNVTFIAATVISVIALLLSTKLSDSKKVDRRKI